MSEILQCPFCRSTNAISHGATPHYVHCVDCGASGPSASSELEAIAKWSRREPVGVTPLTSSEIDDMAFGNAPSGKIVELRELIRAVEARVIESIAPVCDTPEADGYEPDDDATHARRMAVLNAERERLNAAPPVMDEKTNKGE